MTFDRKKFLNTKFQPREAEIEVKDMADFFGGDRPVFTVRGLTGQELGRCNEASQRNKNISGILDGLLSSQDQAKKDAVAKLIGIGETPADIAKRLEQLQIGSVEPKVDWELSVRICETFPIEFYQLTNKILELTGQGHVPGKPKPSGKTAESSAA